MRIDDLTSAPGSSAPLAVRGPAQRAITEFLAVHRTLPVRSRNARAFGLSPLTETNSHWYWSAVGQLEAAAALDSLGPQWRVFHGVPGPAADPGEAVTWIDHLVIGPGGVLTVTVYDHSRQNVWVDRRAFVIDGHRLQYIRTAEAEVGHVERMLGSATGDTVTATAVIAVIDPASLQVRDLPRDVIVVDSATLVSFLRGREHTLASERIELLAAAVDRESTWPGDFDAVTTEVLAGAIEDRAEFAQVRHEVRAARIVRAVWTIGVAGLLASVLVTLGILQLVSARDVGI